MKITAVIKFDENLINRILQKRMMSINKPTILHREVGVFFDGINYISEENLKSLKGKSYKKRIAIEPMDKFVQFLFEDVNMDFGSAIRMKKLTQDYFTYLELGNGFRLIYKEMEKAGFDMKKVKISDEEIDLELNIESNRNEKSIDEINLEIIANEYFKYFREKLNEDEIQLDFDKIYVRRKITEELVIDGVSQLKKRESKLLILEGNSGLGKTFILNSLYKRITNSDKFIFLFKDFGISKLKFLINYKTKNKKILFLDSLDSLLLEEEDRTNHLMNIALLLNKNISVITTLRKIDGSDFEKMNYVGIQVNQLSDEEFREAIGKYSVYYQNINIEAIVELDKLNKNIFRMPILLKLFLEINSINILDYKKFNKNNIYDEYWRERIVHVDNIDSKEFQKWIIEVSKIMKTKYRSAYKSELLELETNRAKTKSFINYALRKGIINKIDKNRYVFFHDSFLEYLWERGK